MAGDRLATHTDVRREDALATYLSDLAPRSYVARDVAAKRSSPNSATGSTRPPKTTSPTGYQPTTPPPRRSPSSAAHAPSRRPSRASWPPRTRAAPSLASSPPARSWECGGCSCLPQVHGPPDYSPSPSSRSASACTATAPGDATDQAGHLTMPSAWAAPTSPYSPASTSTMAPSCRYGTDSPTSPIGCCPALSASHSSGSRYGASPEPHPTSQANNPGLSAERLKWLVLNPRGVSPPCWLSPREAASTRRAESNSWPRNADEITPARHDLTASGHLRS
jgi:hypothetical protein